MLLTTHYMVEADELCDRVAIINAGRVLACDTPAALKRRLQREPIFQSKRRRSVTGTRRRSRRCPACGKRRIGRRTAARRSS